MTTLNEIALQNLAAHPRTPGWVRELLAATGSSTAEVEPHSIDDSYLDFLREQIELGARGPEWTRVLAARLEALNGRR